MWSLVVSGSAWAVRIRSSSLTLFHADLTLVMETNSLPPPAESIAPRYKRRRQPAAYAGLIRLQWLVCHRSWAFEVGVWDDRALDVTAFLVHPAWVLEQKMKLLPALLRHTEQEYFPGSWSKSSSGPLIMTMFLFMSMLVFIFVFQVSSLLMTFPGSSAPMTISIQKFPWASTMEVSRKGFLNYGEQ